jgi:HSP20 family protein
LATQGRPQGFSALRQEMEDLLARMWGDHDRSWWTGYFSPCVDLAETDNAFEIRLDVPGMESKDFEVEVQGNIATIRGERKEEKEEKNKTMHRVERRYGSFSRSLTLPCNVNESEVAADYANGVLTITLPKREDAAPKKISVKG